MMIIYAKKANNVQLFPDLLRKKFSSDEVFVDLTKYCMKYDQNMTNNCNKSLQH